MNLAKALSGEMTYLEQGTKVTTHLASTEMMQRDITREVGRQMQDSISIAVKSLGVEMRKVLENNKGQTPTNGGEVTFNNNYNVTTTTEFDVKNLEDNIEYTLKKQLKASGKRW